MTTDIDSTAENLGALRFFADKSPLTICRYSPTRSSLLKKYVVTAKTEKFFVKFVGTDTSIQLGELYEELSGNHDIIRHLPHLMSVQNGWLVFEWVSGSAIVGDVVRWIICGRPQVVKSLFFSLGAWLSRFHNHMTKEYVVLKDLLQGSLDVFGDSIIDDPCMMPMCKTYNDFKMRNIMLAPDNHFFCIDLDAAFNHKFPQYMLPYHDISTFVLNILSVLKIPLIPLARVRALLRFFMKGYFLNNNALRYSPRLLTHFMRLHFKGILVARSVPELYCGTRNAKFLRKLYKLLAEDNVAFLPSGDDIVE